MYAVFFGKVYNISNERAVYFGEGFLGGKIMNKNIEDFIVSIPDFPEEGIIFRDITSVIQSEEGFKLAVDGLIRLIGGEDFDVVAGIEARGFVFAAPVAYKLGKSLALVRKKGKLPRETVSAEYDLEYGTSAVEMHTDSVKPGQRVVLVDDLIATGGTAQAAVKLIEQLGGEVAKAVFLIELAGLKGRGRLSGCDVDAVVTYEGK